MRHARKHRIQRNRQSSKPAARTLGLIHLGCPKNQVDSEEMLAVLAQDGWTLVGDPDDADVLVVNTCGFIDAAKEESLEAIKDAVRRKKGRCKKVIVAGCLAQRYADSLAKQLPGVDAVVGLGETARMAEHVRSALNGERPVIAAPPPPEWQEVGARLITTPHWTTYLKIGEGCDHRCSFCAIPGFRGDWRSRPAERIISEAKALVRQGLKEAVLIGQDTTLYGRETRGEWSLARLVRELGALKDLQWQRIMYAHPGRVDDDIIGLFGEVENLVPYLDMPFQSGDDRTLKRMKRAGSAGRYLEVIGRLRQIRPDISIRSTFLVGFPGETDEEFGNTCEFVRQAMLDHAGVFVYSAEDGTDAFRMESDVPTKAAYERAAHLMEIQAGISERRLSLLKGQTIDVLVEATVSRGKWLGRSQRDAPEVDGRVTLFARQARLGDIVRSEVLDTSVHDMTARAVESGANPEESGIIPLTVENN